MAQCRSTWWASPFFIFFIFLIGRLRITEKSLYRLFSGYAYFGAMSCPPQDNIVAMPNDSACRYPRPALCMAMIIEFMPSRGQLVMGCLRYEITSSRRNSIMSATLVTRSRPELRTQVAQPLNLENEVELVNPPNRLLLSIFSCLSWPPIWCHENRSCGPAARRTMRWNGSRHFELCATPHAAGGSQMRFSG